MDCTLLIKEALDLLCGWFAGESGVDFDLLADQGFPCMDDGWENLPLLPDDRISINHTPEGCFLYMDSTTCGNGERFVTSVKFRGFGNGRTESQKMLKW